MRSLIKIVLLWCFIVCSFKTFAQGNPHPLLWKYKHLQDSLLQSSALGYAKEISIFLPKNWNQGRSYPLLIHFDNRLPATISTLEQIDKLTCFHQLPEFVIVSITSKPAYKPRALEVLLPRMETIGNARFSKEEIASAKGEELEAFLFNELIPFTQKKFSTDKDQVILVGHSYYGYYTSYLLTQHLDELFAVVSNSPYYYFGKVNIINELEQCLEATDSLQHRTYYYTGIGTDLQCDDRRGWKAMNTMVRTIELPKNFHFQSFDYPYASHNAVPMLSTARALCEIYAEWFELQATIERENWKPILSKQDSARIKESKEHAIAEHYGVEIPLGMN